MSHRPLPSHASATETGCADRARRRAVLGGLWAGLTVGAALGQPGTRIPRIGVLAEQGASEPRLAAIRQGLLALGYVEGQNIRTEYRYLEGAVERAPALLAELLRVPVDVLVVGGTVAALAAQAQTKVVPIVFTVAGDPVASGLVRDLARPGGNLTGLSVLLPDMAGKQIELLKTALPQFTRVAVAHNPVNPAVSLIMRRAREVARSLGVEVQVLEVRKTSELPAMFAAAKAGRAQALLVISDPLFGSQLQTLADLASAQRLPAIYNRAEFAKAGGLLAYGPSFSDNYRRAASYVDRILKGARPADLPVEQPVAFELLVNLKTARAFGLGIPQSLLLRADEVIQ